jgi:hypothetical protein
LSGGVDTDKAILRNYIKATVGFESARRVRMLTKLGRDVEIVVREPGSKCKERGLRCYAKRMNTLQKPIAGRTDRCHFQWVGRAEGLT